jgi:hypothetical protein
MANAEVEIMRVRTNRATAVVLCLLSAACMGELSTSGTPTSAADDPDAVDPTEQNFAEPTLDPWQPLPEEAEAREWRLMRRAIDLGHGLGRQAFGVAVNSELARAGAPQRYELVAGDAADEPEAAPAPESSSCPYLSALGNDGGTSPSCRYLAERARDDAYLEVVEEVARQPLTGEFLSAADPVSLQDWYEYSTDYGVSGELVRAIDDLRVRGLCDAAPTPTESSLEAGVALGRRLMSQAADEVVAATPREVCDIDGGIVAPARERALARVDATVIAEPLCAGTDPASLDDLTRFAQAELDYERGVGQGVREQAMVESEELFRTWICTPPWTPDAGGGGGDGGGGDPLLLDLDGGGVPLSSIASGPMWVLRGVGSVRVGWPGSGDAFVVLDRDGDGRIASSEVFGDLTMTEDGMSAPDGFAALALYDAASRGGDGDGVLDAGDEMWGALGAWNDRDGDATVDEGELRSLADAGVARIDLDRQVFVDDAGRTGAAVDVVLPYVRP